MRHKRHNDTNHESPIYLANVPKHDRTWKLCDQHRASGQFLPEYVQITFPWIVLIAMLRMTRYLNDWLIGNVHVSSGNFSILVHISMSVPFLIQMLITLGLPSTWRCCVKKYAGTKTKKLMRLGARPKSGLSQSGCPVPHKLSCETESIPPNDALSCWL